jgi:Adaptin C-terminal domain
LFLVCPAAAPTLVAFDKNGIKVIFTLDTDIGDPVALNITLTASNSSPITLQEFVFQAAVPKVRLSSWCYFKSLWSPCLDNSIVFQHCMLQVLRSVFYQWTLCSLNEDISHGSFEYVIFKLIVAIAIHGAFYSITKPDVKTMYVHIYLHLTHICIFFHIIIILCCPLVVN